MLLLLLIDFILLLLRLFNLAREEEEKRRKKKKKRREKKKNVNTRNNTRVFAKAPLSVAEKSFTYFCCFNLEVVCPFLFEDAVDLFKLLFMIVTFK